MIMHGIDPYLAERTMEQKVQELQQEAEHLPGEISSARLGRLSKAGRRLLLEAGVALSAMGDWLEQQSERPSSFAGK
jgi:hypothetical protein